jgi:hypothetical protein
MGMFDTLYVDDKFLPVLPELEERGIKFSSFQTKDLECFLFEYHIKEDGKLYKNNTYEKWYVGNNSFLDSEESEKEELEFTPYTGEILFYDCTTGNNGDSVFIDLKIKVIDGIVSAPATVFKISINTKAELDARELKFKILREKRSNDIRYQIYRYLSLKINGLINSLSKVQSYLFRYDVE